jgi:hypothetical protein
MSPMSQTGKLRPQKSEILQQVNTDGGSWSEFLGFGAVPCPQFLSLLDQNPASLLGIYLSLTELPEFLRNRAQPAALLSTSGILNGHIFFFSPHSVLRSCRPVALDNYAMSPFLAHPAPHSQDNLTWMLASCQVFSQRDGRLPLKGTGGEGEERLGGCRDPCRYPSCGHSKAVETAISGSELLLIK